MTDWDKKKKLGDIGENYVTRILRAEGKNVEISKNPYNSKHDIYVDGKLAEIKTQPAFWSKDKFSIQPNQLEKVSIRCQLLYIVSIPLVEKPSYRFASCVFEATEPSKVGWKPFTTKSGKDRIGCLIEDENLKLINRITDESVKKEMIENRSFED